MAADDLAADDERADVRTVGFVDELLDQDVLIQPMKRVDDRAGGPFRLGQHDADALRAFNQLDDHRRPVHETDAIADMVGLAGEYGRRHVDVAPTEHLQRSQLVSGPGDGSRSVQAINAHHLELADHRETVKRDRRADARNDGVDGRRSARLGTAVPPCGVGCRDRIEACRERGLRGRGFSPAATSARVL